MKQQKGFTILEIAVALIILGLLTGAVVNQLIHFQRYAYQTAANTITQGIQSSVIYRSGSLMIDISSTPSARCESADGKMPAMCMEAYRGALWAVFHTPEETIAVCNGSDDTTSTGGIGESPFKFPPIHVRGTGEYTPGNLGAGWKVLNVVDVMVFTQDFDGKMHLQAPDGNIYTSDIKIMSFREYCQTPY